MIPERQDDAIGTKPDCIVLAAGASSRMGRPKLHLPFAGRTVLGTTVARAREAGLRVIVVGRLGDAALDALEAEGILVARNPNPEAGMISSLRAGLAFLGAERFFFIPGDMPLVSAATYQQLLETRHPGPVVAACGGRRGHPVLLPATLAQAIRELPEGRRLRELLDEAGCLLVETDDPGTIADIDLPLDYELALAASRLPSSRVG